MQLHPTITIHEAAELLRKALAEKLGAEINGVSVTSYGKTRLQILFDTNSHLGTACHSWLTTDCEHYTVPGARR